MFLGRKTTARCLFLCVSECVWKKEDVCVRVEKQIRFSICVCVCVCECVRACAQLCVYLYSPDDSVNSEKDRGIVLGILQQFLSQRYRPGTPVYTNNERQRQAETDRQTDEKRPLRFDN